MSLQAIGTHRTAEKGDAIALTVDGRRIAMSHAQVEGRDASQINGALQTAAIVAGVELPPLHVHVNRDGSLALLAGEMAPDFVWPEDREDL